MKIVTVLLALLLLCGCAGPETTATTAGEATESITTIGEATESMTTTESKQFSCDLVFFGDSITADSNFDEFFPELSIVNLGVYGDTLEDLLNRVDSVRAANPEKIFLLGGINCLRPDNVELCLEQYAALLDALGRACPDAWICVESVLPVGAELDPDGRENDAVRRFNAGLEPLAKERGCGFADLYAAYEKNGALNPALTRDGVHLNFTAYGPWADCIAHLINADNQK
ncbi:MAG: hypothetical protein J5789_03680 [Oscillospiraceae bacterium]|nr:hypothetical protein [Oscillospiraceae bacterium]